MLRERVLCPAALAVGLLASIALAVEIAGCDGAGTPSPAGVGSPPRMLYMSQARSDPRRTHYVSPAGSDRGPGTVRRPWQRLDRAVRRLGPGSTLILQPGTYGAPGGTTTIQARGTRARPITLTAAPGGRRVRIKGLVRVSGSHLRLLRLLFEGPTGAVRRPSPDNPRGEEVPLAIYGNDVTIAASEIRGSAWHAGIYSTASRARGSSQTTSMTTAIDPTQHRRTSTTASTGAASAGVVANNVVTRNLARGIQLYPNAMHVEVIHNTIVRNGRAGVQLGGKASHNEITNNIIAANGDAGIRSHALTGVGNRGARNLLWRNGGDEDGPRPAGVELTGTIVADPELTGDGAREPAARPWTVPLQATSPGMGSAASEGEAASGLTSAPASVARSPPRSRMPCQMRGRRGR